MLVISSLLLGLARAAYFPLSNVQYPIYHPKDRVEIYAPNDGFKQLADSDRLDKYEIIFFIIILKDGALKL